MKYQLKLNNVLYACGYSCAVHVLCMTTFRAVPYVRSDCEKLLVLYHSCIQYENIMRLYQQVAM
jgi:hypothetical protein